eukprot:COSAG02_NODE_11849_length_1643_cov_1.113342_2_plen_192_part_00
MTAFHQQRQVYVCTTIVAITRVCSLRQVVALLHPLCHWPVMNCVTTPRAYHSRLCSMHHTIGSDVFTRISRSKPSLFSPPTFSAASCSTPTASFDELGGMYVRVGSSGEPMAIAPLQVQMCAIVLQLFRQNMSCNSSANPVHTSLRRDPTANLWSRCRALARQRAGDRKLFLAQCCQAAKHVCQRAAPTLY